MPREEGYGHEHSNQAAGREHNHHDYPGSWLESLEQKADGHKMLTAPEKWSKKNGPKRGSKVPPSVPASRLPAVGTVGPLAVVLVSRDAKKKVKKLTISSPEIALRLRSFKIWTT